LCTSTVTEKYVPFIEVIFGNIKKVKVSLNMPSVAQRVPGGLGSQISMTFGT